MNLIKTAALGLALLTARSSAASIQALDSSVPDVHFEIGARLKTDTAEPGLFLITLDCTAGSCSIFRISLNQCRSYSGSSNLAFVPAAERATTWDNTLKVTAGQGSFAVEEAVSDALGSTSRITYRFDFLRAAPRVPVTKLTGFSGSFTRNGANRHRAEFVPVTGTSQEFQMNCPLRLPGIG